ncbi:oligosaccharide flippase family protein [Enterococcus faecium]
MNGVWLYVLQFFNTVIPLITIPYITRILTPYNYGEFSSALNLTSYFLVIVEYGFNWSGARKIAIAKNKEDITKIYSSIFLLDCF